MLFDLDGTLLDTAPDFVLALNALRAEEKLPHLAPAAIRPHVSHGSAALIRAGRMSAVEAVTDAISRAQAMQPALNFLVNSDFDRALDKARTQPLSGPFAGVPKASRYHITCRLCWAMCQVVRSSSSWALGCPQ